MGFARERRTHSRHTVLSAHGVHSSFRALIASTRLSFFCRFFFSRRTHSSSFIIAWSAKRIKLRRRIAFKTQ